MNTSIQTQIQDLQAQIAEATEKRVSIEGKLHVLDELLNSSSAQRQQYQLLEQACTSLDQLSGMGAANLFWESGDDSEKHLQRARAAVAEFHQKTSAIEQSRSELLAEIANEKASTKLLRDHLEDLKRESETVKHVYHAERPIRDLPYRPAALPWSHRGEDERRYRTILGIVFFFVMLFGGLAPLLKKPVDLNVEPEVIPPERIARLIKQSQEAKIAKKEAAEQKAAEKEAKPEEKKKAEKPEEKVAEKVEEVVPEKEVDKPSSKPETDVAVARKSAETKGVLAFKNSLQDILKDSDSLKMGSDAKISINTNQTGGDALQRSIIVSQQTGGSGGINTSNISRDGGGGGGQRIAGESIKFSHIEGGAGIGSKKKTEHLSNKDLESTRGDEELQLVFDRYKSALNRIYIKEQRANPSLRGRIVVQLVIQPDGTVSSCIVKTTEFSEAMTAAVVDRILKFNFGVKEGVPAMTLVYPIDFLPES